MSTKDKKTKETDSQGESKFGTCKVGNRISSMAEVTVAYSLINPDLYRSVPLTTNLKTPPIPEQANLNLKPLTHFNYEKGSFELCISVQVGEGYMTDPNNSIECLSVGNNLLIFLNYHTIEETSSTPFMNYHYTIQFNSENTNKIKGKQILIVTASGDPEEGSATKVIVEDEDEI